MLTDYQNLVSKDIRCRFFCAICPSIQKLFIYIHSSCSKRPVVALKGDGDLHKILVDKATMLTTPFIHDQASHPLRNVHHWLIETGV